MFVLPHYLHLNLTQIKYFSFQVEGSVTYEAMLTTAHELRIEREREKELISQRQDEEASLSHRDQRLQCLQQQLKDLRHASVGATPQGWFGAGSCCIIKHKSCTV